MAQFTADDFKWLVTLGGLVVSAITSLKLSVSVGRALQRQDEHGKSIDRHDIELRQLALSHAALESRIPLVKP